MSPEELNYKGLTHERERLSNRLKAHYCRLKSGLARLCGSCISGGGIPLLLFLFRRRQQEVLVALPCPCSRPRIFVHSLQTSRSAFSPKLPCRDPFSGHRGSCRADAFFSTLANPLGETVKALVLAFLEERRPWCVTGRRKFQAARPPSSCSVEPNLMIGFVPLMDL